MKNKKNQEGEKSPDIAEEMNELGYFLRKKFDSIMGEKERKAKRRIEAMDTSLQEYAQSATGEHLKEFVVGRFYRVQTSSWTGKKYPALCVRKSKRRIHFECLCRGVGEIVYKYAFWRSLSCEEDGTEFVYDNQKHSVFAVTYPWEIAHKPKRWDKILSEKEAKAKWRE